MAPNDDLLRDHPLVALALHTPLTQIALEIPLVDINAIANRDIATRQAEIGARTKAKKWLNYFQLYLKAMRPRATHVSGSTVQGLIVTLVRDSWNMEPEHVKQQYIDWSAIEKTNHYAAHPKPVPIPKIVKAANAEHLLFDVDAFVNRPLAVRRAEKFGMKKLPPKKLQNSFLLYKMEFKDTLTLLCSDPRQTIKNKAWSESWKLETKEVKDQYTQYMKTENTEFLRAFPDVMGQKFADKLSTKRKADEMEKSGDEQEDE